MEQSLELKINKCSTPRLALRLEQNAQYEAATNGQKQLRDCSSATEYRATFDAAGQRWLNPEARIVEIPSNHGEETIPLRCIAPENSQSQGVWLHFHAGGFVIGSNSMYDRYLTDLANELELVIVSVDYRLAPENPWPAAGEDCLQAALYALSDQGAAALGGQLRFIGGESAGGFLTVWTALQLRYQGIDVRSKLDGLICSYGIYDLTYTPSLLSHQKNVVLGSESTFQFIDSAFPRNMDYRKKADVSPLYANLERLPCALFLIGTAEPLYDDSVFMATKWYFAGNKTRLRIVAEAFHGFTLMPCDANREGLDEIIDFVKSQRQDTM